ncbi:flagellar hook assembly protein FlgD [Zobellella maritima]|uniref:flagellar hook assembly protein FlgD n=1 Tax=Zobellella maritima TaxID=2059725 RepID=UPI000E309892|nr:flagellar hook assembly protein FlgD [Zobellella maritima]
MAGTINSNFINSLNIAKPQTAGTRVSEDLQGSFMSLLVTQLKNQDPLNPMDNSEMTSQLAQINTVSGIASLNETMQIITGQIDAGQTLQATALIGKDVLVPGERLLLGEDGASTPFGIELASPAERVTISILDGSGQPVRDFELGRIAAGVESFVWDGTLNDGSQAPAGAYQLSVTALSGGRPLSHTSLNYARVLGISTGAEDGPRLDLGGVSEQIRLDDVRQIL